MPASAEPAPPAPGCACSRLYHLPGDDSAPILDRLRPYVPPDQAGQFGVRPAQCTSKPGAPRYWPD